MTNWTIQRCPNIPSSNDDEGAFLDDGSGPGWFRKGYGEAWEYIGGNAEPGDTVTVLEDFTGDTP
jgi:hypothetical protein